MPVYSCGDGKYRIGDGPCKYTSRESAVRVYVAYLASNGDSEVHNEEKVDKNRVSFDFDDTLEYSSVQQTAKRLMNQGYTVYVITRRQESANKEVYAVTDELGIPRRRVYFTNGAMKWETVKRLNIGRHYDNNEDELKLIRENTDAETYKINASEDHTEIDHEMDDEENSKSFNIYIKEETYNDYPESATNNAKRALKYKEENGSNCGTPVGWTRARQLANRESISRETIARMASFKRHQQNKDVPYDEGCGGIMWDAWGGDAGIEWAIRKLEQIDKKEMIYGYKSLNQSIKDVDAKKGIVTGYFSAFNIKDSDGDIIRPGAFKKSIEDWFPKGRIKHLMNHDPSKPLGVIQVLKEDEYGLYYESKVGTHNLGQDFLKMVESDLVKEHSIGFSVVREQKGQDGNEMFDLKLYEGSSLTAWGANEFTPLLGMKSAKEIKDRIKTFEKFVRNTNATDEAIEMCLLEIKQLYQAVETLSSKKVVVETPTEQKSENDLMDAINLITLKHF